MSEVEYSVEDLGAVTAYAQAVENGYTGTLEQWAQLQMNAASNYQELFNEIYTKDSSAALWEQGGLSMSTGASASSTTRIRTTDFLPDSVAKITTETGYYIILYAYYITDGSFVGVLKNDYDLDPSDGEAQIEFLTSGSYAAVCLTGSIDIRRLKIATRGANGGMKFKVLGAYGGAGTTAITPAAASNFTFYENNVGYAIDNDLIAIGDNEPSSERAVMWINDDASTEIHIPEIDDAHISDIDTWSSEKIDEEMGDLKSAIESTNSVNNITDVGYKSGIITQTNITFEQDNHQTKINGSSSSSLFVSIEGVPTKISSNYSDAPLDFSMKAGKQYKIVVQKESGSHAGGINDVVLFVTDGTDTLLQIPIDDNEIVYAPDNDVDVTIGVYIKYSTSVSNLIFREYVTENDIYVEKGAFADGAINALNGSIQNKYSAMQPTMTNDSVIRGTDAHIISGAGSIYNVSELIPVTAGDQYRISSDMNWGNYFYRFYQTAGLSDYGFGGEKSNNVNAATQLTNAVFVIPANAEYTRVCAMIDSTHVLRLEKVTPVISGVDVNWSGKKWVCIGDSLTEANATASQKYHSIISNLTGITVLNYGKGGTGYMKTYSTSEAFYNRVLTLTDVDCDVITIFGSFNDLSLDLGTADDTGTSTIGGCMNTTFDNLYDTKPFVSVGVILPTPWWGRTPDGSTENSAKAVAYCNMLLEICRKRSIPVLDLFHNSNFHPNQSNYRDEYFDQADGTHPNDKGHAKIAPMIYNFLKQIIEL